jgi:hypothetical protein
MDSIMTAPSSTRSSTIHSRTTLKAVGDPTGQVVTIAGERYLSTIAAAHFCNLSYEQLKCVRLYDHKLLKTGEQPRGPHWVKLVGTARVFYSVAILTAWLEADKPLRIKRSPRRNTTSATNVPVPATTVDVASAGGC